MTPYEVVYGQKPLSMTSYLLGTYKVHVVDKSLHTRESIFHKLKDKLVMAQNRMKQQSDQHCLEHSFAEGNHVFLHLQPYKQTSLKDKIPQK
jgi:hypothetical protein